MMNYELDVIVTNQLCLRYTLGAENGIPRTKM